MGYITNSKPMSAIATAPPAPVRHRMKGEPKQMKPLARLGTARDSMPPADRLKQEHPLPWIIYEGRRRLDTPENIRKAQWAAHKAERHGFKVKGCRVEMYPTADDMPEDLQLVWLNRDAKRLLAAPGCARYNYRDTEAWVVFRRHADDSPVVFVEHPVWRDQSEVLVSIEGEPPRFGTIRALHYDDHLGRFNKIEFVTGKGKYGPVTASVHPQSALPETEAALADLFAT